MSLAYATHRCVISEYRTNYNMGRGQYDGQGVYCGLSTASEVFLIFTTPLYQYFSICIG